MGEDVLAQVLVELGRSVVTFDPPGAYRSTRPMRCDMAEMVDCAVEAPRVHRRAAVERPAQLEPVAPPRVVGLHLAGVRLMLRGGALATYRRLDNLVERASYVDPRQAQLVPVTDEDAGPPPPPRARWLRSVRGVEYRHRLDEVPVPGLVVVGRHDPQTPLPCSQELVDGMTDARLDVFERSGHARSSRRQNDSARSSAPSWTTVGARQVHGAVRCDRGDVTGPRLRGDGRG
jgi:proline iminopeptidase